MFDEDLHEWLSTVRIELDKREEAAPPSYYLPDNDDGNQYCWECLKKLFPDDDWGGGAYSVEYDSCMHCETCGRVLSYVLTNYGAKEELEHFSEHTWERCAASLTVIKSCSPMCFPPFSPAARSDGGVASKSAVLALSCAAWRSARRCVPGWNEARLERCERWPRWWRLRPCGRVTGRKAGRVLQPGLHLGSVLRTSVQAASQRRCNTVLGVQYQQSVV